MENSAKDIAEIAAKLSGKVNFTEIKFSQILSCDHGEDINHLMFLKYKFGVYFYTNNQIKDISVSKKVDVEIFVCTENTKNLYKIS